MTRQITTGPHINHPTYFLQSSFFPGDREMFFTSYRTGDAQLFEVSLDSGETRQLTQGAPIHPYSAALHPDGETLVVTRGGELSAIRRASSGERRIFSFEGAQLGECSISRDGEWLTAAYKHGAQNGLVAGRFDGSGWRPIPFPRTVIHPQFHPLESEWIEFSGDPAPRMHRVRYDGTGLECLHEHGNDEFIVHETFLGSTGNLVFTVWPHALRVMDWTTRAIRTIETGARRHLCDTLSSNQGSQWRKSTYALADDFQHARNTLSWMESAADTVYGPQHTHPHPSWSNNEQMVTFASDQSGVTQVYVCKAP
jgi:hypothetical protein